MREKAKTWIVLDTSETVSKIVDWGNCSEIHFLHNNCKLKLHNARALDQAKKVKRKERSERRVKALAKKIF